MQNKKNFIIFFSLFTLIALTVLYSYSNQLKKEPIHAVLQYQINLETPPTAVYAITTQDQKLPTGKKIPQGTRFIGALNKDQEIYIVNFNTIQTASGRNEKFSAKTILSKSQNENIDPGISSKISKTLQNKTKSNILGAIFKSSSDVTQISGTILPRGTAIKIEADWE